MFPKSFKDITGHSPFPWQEKLFEEFAAGEFRPGCDVPTGLGKTSVITLWLLALGERLSTGRGLGDFPRRLIYIVNRRTVVDQATREAERLRAALEGKNELAELANALGTVGIGWSESPLAISTLRGELADNAEWRMDPARAAIVIGTVDMIGSRLLFAGYGCGFKSRPLHAAFLAQDSLLIHDEAHLEPAFQKLLEHIEREQHRGPDFRPLRLMQLTATTRSNGESLLSAADLAHAEVAKRVGARKGIEFVWVADRKAIPEQIAECALKYRESGQAILIFVRTIEHLQRVQTRLEKEKAAVQTLTGTMRGWEREALLEEGIFARFMPAATASSQDGTVYLICTSAGEVGIDISADHLVCDLTPFDSMAQRFGRVNRFGNGDAVVQVVCESSGNEAATAFEERCQHTLSLLQQLSQRTDGRYDASPAALNRLPANERHEAFTPEPKIRPATGILFDAWAMTTAVDELPGRPPIADWLHGVAEWDPPETSVAWRSEVEKITGELLELYYPAALLEDYPLKAHELLRDRSERIFEQLCQLASIHGGAPAWIVSDFGQPKIATLSQLADGDADAIRNRIVLLPPFAGGLNRSGMLDGKAEVDSTLIYDVADEWLDTDGAPRRQRVWGDAAAPARMRLVRSLDLALESDDETDEEAQAQVWRWYVRPRSADDDGSRTAMRPQELSPHLKSAREFALAIVERAGVPECEAAAVVQAAAWHDLGKRRERWQRSIRNTSYPDLVLAKSDGRMWPAELGGYRHEFGSVMDLKNGAKSEFSALTPEIRDLILHLIAAHHGRARPHFPPNEVFDPERDQAAADEMAREVPRRFARLQQKYGRWGLAYLESLVRAADVLASQELERDGR